MAKEWTHIRVQQQTAEAIRQEMVSVMESYQLGETDGWWDGDTLTMDEFIAKMVADRRAKRERARKARKARKARRDAEVWAMTFAPVF